ncbi:hypothetical protein FGG08_005320 [Glutinoglossum americanum]|uniref:Uncharacterized protein n=1 Tax=Glutinoglossum americanum TaxID=1670608 RepID=A0A9P8I5N8_9PEZI|nr:hypothetical protein FGG08_005320 [Glutinoglossum americanum]
MGVEPPFLYDPPAKFNDPYKSFNPKSVTLESLTPPKPKRKQEGPLVNFNTHPDSYLILPYGKRNAKPMNPRTKTKIKWARMTVLLLRCCQLMGALALMVNVICIRGTDDSTGWLLRVPPGAAIMHTTYSIYHLVRRAAGRTPASTASYMLFSAAADASLIPFYVFAALLSHAQKEHMRWTTVFNDPAANKTIIFATFLTSCVNSGFHFTSFLLSIYLAVIYRKIAKLPPDMNPLEDNLTSRHKKKNSSVSTTSEKHMSQASSFYYPTDENRSSRLGDPPVLPPLTIPFMHTRMNSTDSVNSKSTTPRSSNRNSRADLPSQSGSPTRASRASLSRASPTRKTASNRSSYASLSPDRQSNFHGSLANDSWFTYLHHAAPGTNENHARTDSSIEDFTDPSPGESYLPQEPPTSRNLISPRKHAYAPLPNPLESHPPTPPPLNGPGEDNNRPDAILAQSSANRSSKRYYGELKPAATPKKGPPVMGTYIDLPPEAPVRAVSNTGAEFEEVRGGTRRREVSGKVAEEGRAGGDRSGGWLRWRRGSGKDV